MLRDLFDNGIPTLERWSKREVMSARKLSQPVEALNAMTRGVRPPQQVPIQTGGGAAAGIVTTIQYAAVREIPADAVNSVKAQAITPKLDAEEVWQGEWQAVGDIVDVLVYPSQRPGDFAEYVWPEGTAFNSFLTPLPIVKVGDHWWLWQYIPYAMQALPDDMVFGDCQLQGGA